MYNITAIISQGQGIGFQLAGIQVREVAHINDAHTVLAEELESESTGIILLDEAFNHDMTQKLQKKVDESAVPLVVTIPVISRWEQIHDRDEIIGSIIQRAVGYRIKLSEE